jgi:hypothetical protein
LVAESSENMQLFNSYMKEMEQRLFDKNREIDSLRAKLKNADERAEKAEARLANEANAKSTKR